ncbi:MAG: hypothetical protein HOI95_27320, partial [Chromatiales bacterium]|nr:hypothetical protein [Chromatiales bacterium]
LPITTYADSWYRKRQGAGLGITELAGVMAALASTDVKRVFSLICHNNLTGAIASRGSSAQRERYLEDMISGRLLGGFLLTEPGTGSDAGAIETTAIRDGDGWVLNGAERTPMDARRRRHQSRGGPRLDPCRLHGT